MKMRCAAAALLLAALGLSSCATARLVSVERKGGVVAIPSNLKMHRRKAESLMARSCPAGYSIVREEEAVVGTRWSGETTVRRDTVFDETTTTKDYSVRPQTEWRILFECR